MKLLGILNPENVTNTELDQFEVREAVRGIVYDSQGKIALLHVANENYYKLPGGGVEGAEDHTQTFLRECLEEIGTPIEIIDELGEILEYRKIFHIKQVSYCYTAKVIGDKGIPNFTDKERSQGFKVVWLSLSEAREMISKSSATTPAGELYIVPRDLLIIDTVITV